MKSETKLKKTLSSLIDTKTVKKSAKLVNKEKPVDLQDSGSAISFEKKRKDKFLKTLAEEKLSVEDKALIKKEEENVKPKTVTQAMDESLKAVQAHKFQMMTKANNEKGASSPLRMHLIQSESLKIAQEKISDLEDEISSLRAKK